VRAGKAAVVFYRKHPECSDMLRVEDAVSPEIRENLYDAVLKYYYAVGVQAGLSEFRGNGLDTAGFRIPLEDTLESWSGRVSAHLLRRLTYQSAQAARLREECGRLAEDLRAARERAEGIEGKNRALARDLELHRAFAEQVKRSLPYRIYKSLKALRGGDGS
jgi:hypothetical protein